MTNVVHKNVSQGSNKFALNLKYKLFKLLILSNVYNTSHVIYVQKIKNFQKIYYN